MRIGYKIVEDAFLSYIFIDGFLSVEKQKGVYSNGQTTITFTYGNKDHLTHIMLVIELEFGQLFYYDRFLFLDAIEEDTRNLTRQLDVIYKEMVLGFYGQDYPIMLGVDLFKPLIEGYIENIDLRLYIERDILNDIFEWEWSFYGMFGEIVAYNTFNPYVRIKDDGSLFCFVITKAYIDYGYNYVSPEQQKENLEQWRLPLNDGNTITIIEKDRDIVKGLIVDWLIGLSHKHGIAFYGLIKDKSLWVRLRG